MLDCLLGLNSECVVRVWRPKLSDKFLTDFCHDLLLHIYSYLLTTFSHGNMRIAYAELNRNTAMSLIIQLLKAQQSLLCKLPFIYFFVPFDLSFSTNLDRYRLRIFFNTYWPGRRYGTCLNKMQKLDRYYTWMLQELLHLRLK